jgi:Protein of unknown function (DUF4238)
MSSQFTQDNHYVSQTYLKQWASEGGRVGTYRILVSNDNVPLWKFSPIKGIAYRKHLYTRTIAGGETDEIEKWLDHEFESPAERVIQKVVLENRLTPTDWKLLVKFLAAQDVRTPSRLAESLERWNKTMPDLLQETLEDAVHELEEAKKGNRSVKPVCAPHSEMMPLSIHTEIGNTSGKATIKAESLVGRGLWLYGLKHLLTNNINHLLHHKWTILKPPRGVNWNTSDDPVIKLNYHNPQKYDFKGGWGSEGTEIMLPISPSHLLYTKVGAKPPQRGTIVQAEVARQFQKFIAEHAHRYIFAIEIDPEVEGVRPRTVDSLLFKEEAEQWEKWHKENTIRERKLLNE